MDTAWISSIHHTVLDPSQYQFSFTALPSILVAFLILILGHIVLFHEKLSLVSVAFFFVSASTFIWLACIGMSYLALTSSLTLWWIRLEHLGVVFIPTTVYFFVLAVLERFHKQKKYLVLSVLVSLFFYAGVLFSDRFIQKELIRYDWGPYAKYGPLSVLFFAFFFFMMVTNLRLLVRDYFRKKNPVQKKRIRAFLLALGLAYLASLDFLPTYGIDLFPMGFLPITAFLFIASWAIWRYRLLDLTPEFTAGHILDAMRGAVFVVDMEGNIRVLNRFACSLLGYDRMELLGKPIGILFESYTPGEVIYENGERGQIHRDHVMGWRTKDGRKIFVSVSTSVVQDERHVPAGVVYVALDITKLKATEEEIRNTQAFLSSILENIPDMIFVKDARELRFVRFNRAGEELLGYPREDLIGKNDYDFFPKKEADFFTSKDRAVLEGRKLEDIPEEPIHTRNKGERVLHTKKIPIVDENGDPQYLLGISEDITEYRKAQEALIQKTAELARSNAEREQLQLFTYLASHDLREPLQKVMGFGDLLKSHYGSKLEERGQDYLERMQNATLRMSHLIEDILRFSRVTTEGEKFERVELGEMAREALVDLELAITESGGTVEVGALPAVQADRMQMRQLFQNLIGNALKFRAKDRPPKVVLESHKLPDGQYEVLVRDNGIGFEEKYLEKIFRPFERLHGRGEYHGSGIGLAICQKIVQRHGGTLTAKSVPGQGSTFIVRLPSA
ncbi:MAG TPA: PAS domain S-box protein [Candidatus Omnitrophota bacterium]|nr:PAS domain S-box protein [Candidatus Omnitrophota bacterium]